MRIQRMSPMRLDFAEEGQALAEQASKVSTPHQMREEGNWPDESRLCLFGYRLHILHA